MKTVHTQADFNEYINTNYQLEIKYPRSWSKKQLEDPITGEIVAFSSPKESESDIFQEKIFVTVEKLPDSINNLDEYAEMLTNRIIDKYKC